MAKTVWFESTPALRRFGWGDLVVVLMVATLLYIGVRLAFAVPIAVQGPDIELSLSALPYYTMLSLGRMVAAYVLSIDYLCSLRELRLLAAASPSRS